METIKTQGNLERLKSLTDIQETIDTAIVTLAGI